MNVTIIQPAITKRGQRKSNKTINSLGTVEFRSKDEAVKNFDYVGCIERDEEDKALDELYEVLAEVEKDYLPWSLVLSNPTRELGKFFERKATGPNPTFEHNPLMDIIQIDVDGHRVGSRVNFKPLDQRLTEWLAGLPSMAFSSCRKVVQQSNKGYSKDKYPDHFAFRVFVELDKPMRRSELKELFTGVPDIDLSLFNAAQLNLIQPPAVLDEAVEGGERPATQDDGTLIIVGEGKIDTDLLQKEFYYEEKVANNNNLKVVTSNLGDAITADSYQIDLLDQMAKEGAFDKPDNKIQELNRNHTHYKVLYAAEWTGQNGAAVIDAIIDKSTDEAGKLGGKNTILGTNSNKEKLEQQLIAAKTYQREFLTQDRWAAPKFDYTVADPNLHDLKDWDVTDLIECMRGNVKAGNNVGCLVRSPYGSGKTTAIVPHVEKMLRQQLGREPTVLYISALRSIISAQAEKLSYQCYLKGNGQVDKEVIVTADRLAICIKSLWHRNNIEVDLVIVDESEEVGLWAGWKEGDYSDVSRDYGCLLDQLHKSKVFLLMDADAKEMSYSLLRRASDRDQIRKKILLHNSASWIAKQGQKLTLYNSPMKVWEELVEAAINNDEFCYFHTDVANDPHNYNWELRKYCDALNTIAGREIAVYFDSSTSNTDLHNSVCKEPDKAIEALYEQGVRVVMLSPVIISGWRYNGKHRFKKSFGFYKHKFLTAPKIIQKIQRVTYCDDHRAYINPSSTYTKLDDLENQIERLWLNKRMVEYSEAFKDDGIELQIEARVITQRMLDNPKLHLCYLWEGMGGILHHNRIGQDDKAELQELYGIVNDSLKKIQRAEAQKILENEEVKAIFQNLFVSREKGDWSELQDLTDVEDVLDLITMARSYKHGRRLATACCALLTATETDFINWAITGSPWEEDEQVYDFFEKMTKAHEFVKAGKTYSQEATEYFVLAKVLVSMARELFSNCDPNNPDEPEITKEDAVKKLLDWLYCSSATPRVIDFKNIDDTEWKQLQKDWGAALKSKNFKIVKSDSYRAFIKSLMKQVFYCEVTEHFENKEKATVARDLLVEEYVQKGIMKIEGIGTREKHKAARRYLMDRIRRELSLSEVEEVYLEASAKIMTITPPEILPQKLSRDIADSLSKAIKRCEAISQKNLTLLGDKRAERNFLVKTDSNV